MVRALEGVLSQDVRADLPGAMPYFPLYLYDLGSHPIIEMIVTKGEHDLHVLGTVQEVQIKENCRAL